MLIGLDNCDLHTLTILKAVKQIDMVNLSS